jgi:hypothetical protein
MSRGHTELQDHRCYHCGYCVRDSIDAIGPSRVGLNETKTLGQGGEKSTCILEGTGLSFSLPGVLAPPSPEHRHGKRTCLSAAQSFVPGRLDGPAMKRKLTTYCRTATDGPARHARIASNEHTIVGRLCELHSMGHGNHRMRLQSRASTELSR